MTKEKQIKSTDWLTRGIPKEQLEREKREAIMSADLQECITYDEWSAREYGCTSIEFDVTAEKMVAKGYRKQSEWISVEERLPELEDGRNWGNHRPRSIRVLCVCQQRSGKTFVKEGYYELFSNKPCWRIPGSIDSVTHWMPLPKPPKMKGGE